MPQRSSQQRKQLRDSQSLNIINDEILVRFDTHKETWKFCEKCTIGKIAHKHVFARGTLPCDILFIGEGPGKTEDLVGFPFVGQAGKIVDNWIQHTLFTEVENQDDNGVGDLVLLSKLKWCITNIVSCRPCDEPGGLNRRPILSEIINCRPRLLEFLEIANPSHIVFLGLTASKSGVHDIGTTRIQKERMLHLRHPAFFLRPESGGEGGDLELGEIDRLKKFVNQIMIERQESH